MKRNGVEITLDNTKDFFARMRKLTGDEVLVGVPADHGGRLDDDELAAANKTARALKMNANERRMHIIRLGNASHNSPSNALIGYIQEFGSSEHNIPPRPHLIPAVIELKPDAIRLLAKSAKFKLDGKPLQAEQALHALGLMAQNRVRMKITQGAGWPPLSARTLAERRRRGRKGTHPLIDTAQYRNSITYVVRRA